MLKFFWTPYKSSLTTDDINEVMSQFGEIKSCTQKTQKSRYIGK